MKKHAEGTRIKRVKGPDTFKISAYLSRKTAENLYQFRTEFNQKISDIVEEALIVYMEQERAKRSDS